MINPEYILTAIHAFGLVMVLHIFIMWINENKKNKITQNILRILNNWIEDQYIPDSLSYREKWDETKNTWVKVMSYDRKLFDAVMRKWEIAAHIKIRWLAFMLPLFIERNIYEQMFVKNVSAHDTEILNILESNGFTNFKKFRTPNRPPVAPRKPFMPRID